MSITLELYRKSRDPKVLKEGPENARFWIKDRVERVSVSSFSEGHLKGKCYEFIRKVLALKPNTYLRVVTCHYLLSRLRISYWAWAFTHTDCYKCHAECAFMP